MYPAEKPYLNPINFQEEKEALYFETTLVKLSLQLLPYFFFFTVINNSFSE